MPTGPSLPSPPRIALSVDRDRTPGASATGGFLNLRRLDVVARFPNGEVSAPFAYDVCDRTALDAVVVVAHFTKAGERHVYLRSCVRPPVALRAPAGKREDSGEDGLFWEVAAGLIEPGESAEVAGARELEEELGFAVDPGQLSPLGPRAFPAPGIIGERHVYLHVEVDPSARRAPSEDGSALERHGVVVDVALRAALAEARAGGLRDAKTELALRRLAELVP